MIRVVIVEKVGLLRSALSAMLASESDVEVLAEVDSVPDAVAVADRRRPDVLVVDLDLPTVDAPGGIARLRARLPGVAVLAMSAHWDADRMRRALDAEVLGFVGTELSPDRFVRLVRTIARGERVIDPRVAAAVFNPPPNPLTERERQVLRAAAEGLPPKEIAARLHLAHGTVRNRLSGILRKTGARNRLEAIRRAEEKGWL